MFNLLKKYNALLEVDMMSPKERTASLRGVFNRDIQNNASFCFKEKKIYPIPADGMDKMEILFAHLTTKVTDKVTMHREYDRERSIRLHWIKHHVDEQKKDDMMIFSIVNGRDKRTYIYDKVEKYVIVLEPKEAKKQNSPYITIPYNRQQLADYLSVDRSAMSNELCKMRDEGLLEFEKNRFQLL